jgi:hypothetical protein
MFTGAVVNNDNKEQRGSAFKSRVHWIDHGLKVLISTCLYAVALIVGASLDGGSGALVLMSIGLSAGIAIMLGLVFGWSSIAGLALGQLLAAFFLDGGLNAKTLGEAFASAAATALAIATIVVLRADRDDPLDPDFPGVLLYVVVFSVGEIAALILAALFGFTSADLGALSIRLFATGFGALALILVMNLAFTLGLRITRRRR